jgi:hypothetical protein
VCKHRRQHGAGPTLYGRHRHPCQPRAQAEQDAEQAFDRLTLEFASTDQRSRYVWQSQAEHLADSLAKVERVSQRGNGDRAQGRQRQAERGGDFNDAPPF